MTRLHITFFGTFSITLVGQTLDDLGTDKVRALLAYLVLEPARTHPRRQLAGLFWPDVSEKQARQSLRDALYRLRQSLDKAGATLESPIKVSADLLLITHQAVTVQRSGMSVALADDVSQFRDHLAAVNAHTHDSLAGCSQCVAELEQAATLYQGELLAGFGLADAPEFGEWLLLQREMLHQQALLTFERLANIYEERQDYEKAAAHSRRLLALDPYRETAQRLLIRLLALRGLPDQALAQFATSRQLLMDEFGAEPEAETVALAEQIRRGELQGRKVADEPESTPPATLQTFNPSTLQHDWREMPTGAPFFGRTDEVAQLESWLVDERCRLVSILAIGGMGKTSLAAEVVPAIAKHFDLVIWRTLLNAPPLTELLNTILPVLSRQQLDALPESLTQQLQLLFGYMQNQHVLLVLDNLESILQAEEAGQYRAGYEEYGQLLQGVAMRQHQGQLLLTSREQPNGIKRLERDTPQVR